MLYKAEILAICPNAKADIVDAMVEEGYNGAWERFGLTSPTAQAKFMGQIAQESAGLTRLIENLNYSATRLCQVWPKRFPTLKDASPYSNNPQALANKVYGGRMGNKREGDGWRYIGRGLKQLTGYDNYKKEGDALGLDLVNNPEQVAQPKIAFLTALSYWKRNIGKAAETSSVETITIAVNGGVNGLREREAATERALEILDPKRLQKRMLELGSKGLDVSYLQASLVELGEKITIDGAFGNATGEAVKRFQNQNALPITGIYDAATRNELQIALGTERFKASPITTPITADQSAQTEEQSKALPDFPLESALSLITNIVISQNGDVMNIEAMPLSGEKQAQITKIKRYATALWSQINELGASNETTIAKQNLEAAILWAEKHLFNESRKAGV